MLRDVWFGVVSILLVVGVCRLGVDRITLGFFEGWISKYPMMHAKGFLVLLLFSGLPDSSACLSAYSALMAA